MAAVCREMGKRYWEAMSGVYEDEVHSVWHSDRRGLLKRSIARLAAPLGAVADVGCGIGHFLPLLAERFQRVYANDLSPALLERARAAHGQRENIVFLPGDIRRAFRRLPRVDCVLSVNALIAPSFVVRRMMLRAMAAILKPGGQLLLVVPSLESVHMVDTRYLLWHCRAGTPPSQALRAAYPRAAADAVRSRQGIIPIDGVATKHFTGDELRMLLQDQGLEVGELRRVEYDWDTELESPPRWMRDPYPWDWLVVARKKTSRRPAGNRQRH